MPDTYFKGYWMITNRCNLKCSYCVLENAPHQVARELDLAGKKALVDHLYGPLGFRGLTLSGGEALMIGKRPPADFLELVRHLRRYKSPEPVANLDVELYSNVTLMNGAVAEQLAGVIDRVAVTVDSIEDATLSRIGRNPGRSSGYLERVAKACAALSANGIAVKLHTVVSQVNAPTVGSEAEQILTKIEGEGGCISGWKFYQYMSYDDEERDASHRIPAAEFSDIARSVSKSLAGSQVALHFKDNQEMDASLFNILSYGNAQYMRSGDSWSTSQRTRDLRTYASMEQLFSEHDIDEARFRRFHAVTR